jgi:hypothetical protein
MSETSQNDWDVVGDALLSHPGGHVALNAIAAHDRLREVSALTIQSLNARITELEAELALRAPEEGWPVPAKLTEDYWESAQ